MDKRLLNTLSYFTEFKHTENIEVFHSLLLKYCLKRLHFTHNGMIARTQLTILHNNAIRKAEQAVTKDKILRYKVQFSKVTQCDVVKPIKKVPEKRLTADAVRNGVKLKLPTAPQFTKPTRKRSKEELIRHHSTYGLW